MTEYLIDAHKPFYWKSNSQILDNNNIKFNYICCFKNGNEIGYKLLGNNVKLCEEAKIESAFYFVEIQSTIKIGDILYPCLEYKLYMNDEFRNSLSKPTPSWGLAKGQNHLILNFSCYKFYNNDYFQFNLRHINSIYSDQKTKTYGNISNQKEWSEKIQVNYFHPTQFLYFLLYIFYFENPLFKEAYPNVNEFLPNLDSKRAIYKFIEHENEVNLKNEFEKKIKLR